MMDEHQRYGVTPQSPVGEGYAFFKGVYNDVSYLCAGTVGTGFAVKVMEYGFTFDNIDWEDVKDVVEEIDELDDEELKELDADDLIARVSGDYVCTSCGSRKSVDTTEMHPKTWCADCGSVKTHRRDDDG